MEWLSEVYAFLDFFLVIETHPAPFKLACKLDSAAGTTNSTPLCFLLYPAEQSIKEYTAIPVLIMLTQIFNQIHGQKSLCNNLGELFHPLHLIDNIKYH